MSLIDRVGRVFYKAFAFDPARLSRDTVPEDIANWDSVGHMRLVSELEAEFGVQFEIDEIMEMASVSKVLDILTARGVGAA
jgi:acyl carrier protein